MARAADWTRRRGIQTAPAAPGAAAVAPAPASEVELDAELANIDRTRRRQQRLAELEAEREEIEEARRQRRVQQQINAVRQTNALEELARGGRGGGAEAEALQEIVAGLARERTELLGALRESQAQVVQTMTEAQRAQIAALEARVAAVPAPQQTDAVAQLVEAVKTLAKLREATESVLPAPPPPVTIDPALSRHDALETLRLQGEIQVRTLQEQGRIEEAKAARERIRADYETRAKRIEGGFGALTDILSPLLGGAAGTRLAGLLGGGDGAASPPAAAAATQTFPCPACQRPLTVPTAATSVVCPNPACREVLIRPGTTPPPGLAAPATPPPHQGGYTDV